MKKAIDLTDKERASNQRMRERSIKLDKANKEAMNKVLENMSKKERDKWDKEVKELNILIEKSRTKIN